VFGKEPSGGHVVVEFPVHKGGRDDGDESDKEEDAADELAEMLLEGFSFIGVT
jgi:hypothetical protein